MYNVEINKIDFSKFCMDHLNQQEKFELKNLINQY